MIPPRKISRIAKEKEDENFEFRTFLKINAETVVKCFMG